MENAADALKIAGGLLIAALLVTLIIVVFRQMSDVEKTKSQQELIRQTTEFNNRFNAYNKQSMYGTDLISVLGLAYSANMAANSGVTYNSAGNENYYPGFYNQELAESINIEFEIKKDIKQTKQTITQTIYTSGRTDTHKERTGEVVIFNAGRTYSLKADPTNSTEMEVLKKIKNIIIDGKTPEPQTETIKYNNRTEIKETITELAGFNDLKQSIFRCESVTYSDIGRIKEMKFVQIEK